MKGQQEMPVGRVLDAPPLPGSYAASSSSRYSRYKVQRREHCVVDVRLLHYEGGSWAPRPARWKRTAIGDESLLLCDQHRREYTNRDNVARFKDGLKPLSGGG